MLNSCSTSSGVCNERSICNSSKLKNKDKDSESNNNSISDGLAASAAYRKGELSNLVEKFNGDENANDGKNSKRIDNVYKTQFDLSTPLEIDSDEEVQQMWKDMENRVTRRRSITVSEAKQIGKSIGRKNMRRTDEEAWLEAGLYQQPEKEKTK